MRHGLNSRAIYAKLSLRRYKVFNNYMNTIVLYFIIVMIMMMMMMMMMMTIIFNMKPKSQSALQNSRQLR